MTTALQIITDAYRENNIVPNGAVLSAALEDEGFRRLKTLISSALGQDIGHPLVDWPVGVVSYNESMSGWGSDRWSSPRPNSRLVFNIDEPQTIYLPFDPWNGARISVLDRGGNFATHNVTLNGNGRSIEGTDDVVLATDDLNREWLYRADMGDWVRVVGLELSSEEMPFPDRFDDYWIIKLAIRLNPRFGRTMTEETKHRLAEVTAHIQSEYRQRRAIHAEPGSLQSNYRRFGRPIDPYNPGFGY
jgi:hypothetical protein